MPLSRLKFLFLGVFCLTGMIGCLLDAVVLGAKPFGEVIVWIVFTGLMAVLYLVLALRAPRWLLAGVIFHFVASHFVRFLIAQFHLNRPAPDLQSGVRFAALTSIVLCLLSCAFFLLFFYREARHSIRLQTELSLAHDMQKTLVPPIKLSAVGWELYGISVPSDNVGGDLVDVVTQQDGSLLAYIADISGHGLPAGILMGRFKTAVRACTPESLDLAALMVRLNNVLPQVKEPEMYATCAAVHIPVCPANPISYLGYVLAGHPAPAVFSRSGSVSRLNESSALLGLLPSPEFASRKIEVHSGDLLFIFTDGLIEILNAQAEEFGWPRLQAIVEHHRNESLKKIADAILSEGQRWGNATDDRTLLLLRFL